MNFLPELWSLVLANSLRASVLIAGVLLLRAVLGRRLPAQCFHLLWVLAAVRLLATAVPESRWSVFNLRTRESPTPAPRAPREQAEGWTVHVSKAPAAEPEGELPRVRVPETEARVRFSSLLPLVWLGGCAVYLAALAGGAWAWRRRLQAAREIGARPARALAERAAAETGWRGRVRLLETDAVTAPAVMGLWWPRLLLPVDLTERLSREELRHVFLHEFAHLRRRDLPVVWLWALARAVHWFNPLVWLAARTARLDAELACDETVLARLEPTARVPYGETLLALVRRGLGRRPALAAGIAESRRALRTRLGRIANYTPANRARMAGGLLLGTLAAVALGANETPAPSAPPAAPTPASVAAPPAAAAPEPAPKVAANWSEGWKVLSISLPREGDMRDAFVELQTPGGRVVTLTEGVGTIEGPVLERVEWAGTPVRPRITLRQGQEKTELYAEATAVSRKETLEPAAPGILIAARFVEFSGPATKALLNGQLGVPDPERMGEPVTLAAVLTPDSSELMIRRLSQQQGADVLAAPVVTTRSGQQATIEISREYFYPWEFEPHAKGKPYVPTKIESRKTGVTLTVAPRLGDGGAIDLDITPDVDEFIGVLNVATGKPVIPAPDFTKRETASQPRDVLLQPLFSRHKVQTSVTIFDGQTVVLFSPRQDDTAKFSKANPATDRRLMMLVTARRVPVKEPPR